MTDHTLTLVLTPNTPESLTPEDLDDLTRALARQLDAPELTASAAPAGPVPGAAGAKGLGQDLGKLVIEVLPNTVPALVAFLKGFVTRESRVKIKVQQGTDSIELEFDARTMDEARLEIFTRRLLKQLKG